MKKGNTNLSPPPPRNKHPYNTPDRSPNGNSQGIGAVNCCCKDLSSCNSQKEHCGEVTFPNLKSILLAYRILCKRLYCNTCAIVSKVVLRIRKLFFFQLNWNVSKRFEIILCCQFNSIRFNKN